MSWEATRGPRSCCSGADLVLGRHDGMRFRLFGDEKLVRPLLEQYPRLKAASDFEHCEVTVRGDDKPSQALRRGRGKSSMWRAIEAVKEGAGFAVSAGNTGALMAMALFCLRGENDIDRPAIAGIWPTLKGEAVVLDIGATIGADAEQLFEYAVMGAAMARALFDKERPTVGLLNIGVEEIKGLEEIRLAGQMLKEADLPYLDYARLRRGRRHRQGHHRRGGDRGLCRQHRAEVGRGHGQADHVPICARRWAPACQPGSATCWRAVPSIGCATGWIRGAATAAPFSGSADW